MADELMLDIVTPEQLVFSDVVEEVTISGIEGEFGVLIGHTPFLSAVKPGELNFTKNGKKTYFAASGGYSEATAVKVTVLVENVVPADKIDLNAVKQEKADLEAKLETVEKDDSQYLKLKDAIAWAAARIQIAAKARSLAA